MRLTDIQQSWLVKGRFRSFNTGKKLLVSEQMPNCFSSFTLDRQNTEQAQPALELKNKIVTWSKLMWHVARRMLRKESLNRNDCEDALVSVFPVQPPYSLCLCGDES